MVKNLETKKVVLPEVLPELLKSNDLVGFKYSPITSVDVWNVRFKCIKIC